MRFSPSRQNKLKSMNSQLCSDRAHKDTTFEPTRIRDNIERKAIMATASFPHHFDYSSTASPLDPIRICACLSLDSFKTYSTVSRYHSHDVYLGRCIQLMRMTHPFEWYLSVSPATNQEKPIKPGRRHVLDSSPNRTLSSAPQSNIRLYRRLLCLNWMAFWDAELPSLLCPDNHRSRYIPSILLLDYICRAADVLIWYGMGTPGLDFDGRNPVARRYRDKQYIRARNLGLLWRP